MEKSIDVQVKNARRRLTNIELEIQVRLPEIPDWNFIKDQVSHLREHVSALEIILDKGPPNDLNNKAS